jgi:hypothetical protein
MDLFLGGIAAEVGYPLPQAPVRIDARKSFTEHDEACNMKDGFGRELMQLHAIYKEKPMKEFVDRQR